MSTPKERVENYEFTHLKLSKTDFDNLIFMNPPEREDKWNDSTLEGICVKPLNQVAQEVINLSGARKKMGQLIYLRIWTYEPTTMTVSLGLRSTQKSVDTSENFICPLFGFATWVNTTASRSIDRFPSLPHIITTLMMATLEHLSTQ